MDILDDYRRLHRFEEKGVNLNDKEVESLRKIGGGFSRELKGQAFNLTLRYRYNTYLRLIFGKSKYHYKTHKGKLFVWRIE